ncbi:MAG: hypothetical protein R2822_29180 [Spirosomataceae bacterium]
MKKPIFFSAIIIYFLSMLSARSCDVCGCGATNYNFGILPQFHKNFIGIRYRYQHFESHPQNKGAFVNTQDIFQSTELWGRFYIAPRLQVLAIVPYSFNTHSNYAETKHLQGLGDASALINYNVLDRFTLKDSVTAIKHNLWVGMGIKTASGKYQYDRFDFTQVANANFQLGSGSWDILLSAIYTFRYRNFGLNSNTVYRRTTQNPVKYQFGNRLNTSLSAFYVKQFKTLGLMPNAGVLLDWGQKDRSESKTVVETGGYAALLTGGVDVYRKSWSIGISAQIPIQQNLGEGHLMTHERVNVNLTYLF